MMMGQRRWPLGAVGLLGVCVGLLSGVPRAGAAARGHAEGPAAAILRATGVSGGLCVLLGSDDAALAADFARRGSFLVHCLHPDRAVVARLRADIQARGLAGKVCADCSPPQRLPYADNLVRLLVAEDPQGLPAEEVMRVLCPKGVAYTKAGAKWEKRVKPWPKDIDEWTHWLHGADGNAVARDLVVGPPRHVQWVAGPLWLRHHNTVPSVSALVSSNGRVFTITDEGAAGIRGLPDRWALLARDAFSGVLLWKRPIAHWGWRQWSDREISRFNQPTQLPRRLVAVGDTVYVTLGFNAPLTALDAATGKTLRTYKGTDFTSEFLYHDGTLIVSVNRAAQKPGRVAKAPPVKKRILAIQADTGALLWEKGDFVGVSSKADAMERITHLHLAAGGGQLFLVADDAVASLDLKTGAERWRSPRPPWRRLVTHFGYYFANLCTLVYHDGVVLLAQPDDTVKRQAWNKPVKTTLLGLDASSGKRLWSRECGTWGHYNEGDVFAIDRLVWVHDFQSYSMLGLDPRTGQIKRKLSTDKALNKGHHHRCYRNKATTRYILTSRRGVEFIDLASGRNRCHHWVRGACRFGIVPCNGLLYSPPHPCICYVTAKLNGFLALAPARRDEGRGPRDAGKTPRLERGPAFAAIRSPRSATRNGDWPTYRHDAARTGATAAAVPTTLGRLWQADLGAKPSGIVAAAGKVLVASVDARRVHALDAADGKPLWSFTAGGRVDSPPTIHKGLALFGSADGWVYCLRASDGALAWRFRAAPEDRRVVAFGQVESAWPVHGSLLVSDDVVYAEAGRSSFLDDGIHLYALHPRTGKLLQHRRLYSPDPKTGEMAECRLPYDMPPDQLGALPDILSSDGSFLYMRHVRLDPKDIARPLKKAPPPKLSAKRRRVGPVPGPQVVSNAGFLDDTWFNQTYWTFRGQSHCKLLVCDAEATYGIKPFPGSHRHSRALFQPGGKGYKLFAFDNKLGKQRWAAQVPVRVKAMVVAGGVLFAAGAPDVVEPDEPWAAFDGKKGAVLLAFATADGKKLAEHKLGAPPVFDGMAAADGRLYISGVDGKVRCFGSR